MPSTVTWSARRRGTAAPRSSVEHPAMAGRIGAAMAALRIRRRSTPIGADLVSLPEASAILEARGFMVIGSLARIAVDQYTSGGADGTPPLASRLGHIS